MLHTVNKSPFEKNSFETCLRLAKAGSDILLIEDAVYAAICDSAVAERVTQALTEHQHKLYALSADLQARGLEPERVIDGVEIIDYDGFVKLAVANERCQAWL